jgi:hypothetical protein
MSLEYPHKIAEKDGCLHKNAKKDGSLSYKVIFCQVEWAYPGVGKFRVKKPTTKFYHSSVLTKYI